VLLRNNKTRNKNIRSSRFFFIIFFIIFCLFSSSFARAENGLIKFYQEHISVVDGNRCPMVPSCSSYASKAIEKHGPVIGWMMALDRLVRCGRDETRVSKKGVVNHREYTFDPVEANDFWWFERKEK
jgi:putative component of membrane protein insertase Oxa1/YidC/SpoIIIJ protein YidD